MKTRRDFLSATLGAGVVLSLPSVANARVAGGGALAVVTADLQSHVVILELATGRVLERVHTPAGPRSVESALGTLAIVAHTALGQLTIVHPYEPAASVVVSGLRTPRYTAVVAPLAYVTDSGSREVVVLDLLRQELVSRLRVPGPARHVSASPDGSALWTALGSKAERVAVVDLENPTRPRVARSFAPPAPAHDVVFAPDGNHVWITSGTERRLWVYETAGGRPVAELEADAAPQHIAWVGSLAFVASGESGALRVLRADGTDIDRVAIPPGSYNVSFGASRVVTPSLDRGTVTLLDQRRRVRLVRRVARSAHDACVVSDIREGGLQ